MIRSRVGSRIALLLALLFVTALPALAQSGSPQLDPTNGTTGTAYTISVQGSAKPFDPAGGKGSTGKLVGAMTIFQAASAPDFTADLLIDANGDGVAQGMLTCDGAIGSGRVGFSCQGVDDDGDAIFVLVSAKAVSRNAKVAFQAGKGLGFSEHSSLSFVFMGQQD